MLVNIYTKNADYHVEISLPEQPAPRVSDLAFAVNGFLKAQGVNLQEFPDRYLINGQEIDMNDDAQQDRPLSDLNVNNKTAIDAYCDLGSQLVNAVRVGEAKAVDRILQRSKTQPYVKTFDIKPLHADKKPLLCFLAEHADMKNALIMTKSLLAAGADPTTPDSKNNTPLVVAIRYPDLTKDHVDLARYLINTLQNRSDQLKKASEAIAARLATEQRQHHIDLLYEIRAKIPGKLLEAGSQAVTDFYKKTPTISLSSSSQPPVQPKKRCSLG